MRRLKLDRWLAPLALAILFTQSPASAQEAGALTLSGTFDMESLEQYGGTVGADLAGLYARGNAHWWLLTLYGVTYSHDLSYWESYDEFGSLVYADQQYITRVHATSFDLQFFGIDADSLNQIVSSQLTGGDLTGGACLELTNGRYFDAYDEWGGGLYAKWTIGLAPPNPAAGVSFFAVGSTYSPLPADADGYPVVTPRRVSTDRTVIRDRRPGDDGALVSHGNALEIGSAGAFLPRVKIGDASVSEGNRGTTSLKLPVTLSWATEQTVTVGYATADGTAQKKSDYTASSGRLTFQPGQTSRAISVSIKTDRKREPNETFTVQLSNAVGATIYTWWATVTILNDD
jgi:hypothetical protein